MVKGVALPTKAFDSLRESIYLSLKNKTNLVYREKVSSCTLITAERFQRVDDFVTVTKMPWPAILLPGKIHGYERRASL